MVESLYNPEELDQAKQNYEDLIKKSKAKFAVQRTLLWQGLLASVSLVLTIIASFGSLALLATGHYIRAGLMFVLAVYEAWWFMRKLLGSITLIVGKTK